MVPSGLERFRESISSLNPPTELILVPPPTKETKTFNPRKICVAGGNNPIPLQKYLLSQSESKFVMIYGRTYTYHSFGPAIGQCEIDSDSIKSIKGDLYILNSGIHVLQVMSALAIKTPIL